MQINSLIGKDIGGYHLESLLGSGGMGAVFLARSLKSPAQMMAIKIFLPTEFLSGLELERFRSRFYREAEMHQLIQHPHILTTVAYGLDEPSGHSFMVLPYINGGTLRTLIDQGPLPLHLLPRYILPLAQALDYAHSKNIIHRDIKPANILLDEQHNVYLTDFGIAKIYDIDMTTLTATNQMLGTPAYMAPEQFTNETLSPATDVYGLASVIYELITGQRPYIATTPFQVFFQILNEIPARPHTIRTDLPVASSDVIMQAFEKKPENRFRSAGSFAQALLTTLQESAHLSSHLVDLPTQQTYPSNQPPTAIHLDTAPPITPVELPKSLLTPSHQYNPITPNPENSPYPTQPAFITKTPASTQTQIKRVAPKWPRTVLVTILVLCLVLGGGGVGLLLSPWNPFTAAKTRDNGSSARQSTMTEVTMATPADEVQNPRTMLSCGGFNDDFKSQNLTFWQQLLPNGDTIQPSTYNSSLVLSAPNNSNLIPGMTNAPRLQQQLTGNFTIQTVINFDPHDSFQSAGLLIWLNEHNFIRLERAKGDIDGILFAKVENGNYIKMITPFNDTNKHAPTHGTQIGLRLQRHDNTISAEWQDLQVSTNWYELDATNIQLKQSVEVGLTVLNVAPANANPNLAATAQFTNFELIC